MSKKTFFAKNHVNAVIIIAIIAAAGLLILISLIYRNNPSTLQNTYDSRPDVEEVSTLDGKVTMITRSCGAESIDPNEDVRKYAICDGRETMRIDNKTIRTSSNAPGSEPKFHVDTKSISLGDTVLVHYVTDNTYGASLNCLRCFISVIKPSN